MEDSVKAFGLKQGKKPLSQKQELDMADWSPVGNSLTVPPRLVDRARQEGIEFRWVSEHVIRENSGFHPKGWKLYKVKDVADLGLGDFHIGRSDDGVLRRGKMLLAFKPVAAAEYHRDFLREKAQRNRHYAKHKAEQLRSMSDQVKVIEGYEENK